VVLILCAGQVVCDHSPCPPEMKRLDAGSWFMAWGGISSVQLSFSVTFTEAIKVHPTPLPPLFWI
jgi:dihydroorotase-like cyclic amidohydrolase